MLLNCRQISLAAAGATLCLLAACSPAQLGEPLPARRCTAAFVGDAGAPVEVEPGLVVDGAFASLADGGEVPLVTPPQGGHVVFVAARVRNVDPCNVTLRAVLRNVGSRLSAGEESRSVDFDRTLDGDGWAYADLTDIAAMANVAVCPAYFGDDVVDAPATLEVGVRDRGGRSGFATRDVTPRCTQPDDGERALCRCECAARYTLGRCADAVDAGWLDGGPHDASRD